MTRYYVFERISLVGCWADDLDEASDYLAVGLVDTLNSQGSGRMVHVSDTAPDGSEPFKCI